MATQISKPIFVKIRLLNTVEESIRLCRQLVQAGACLITIHGRYRVNLVGRSGAGARDGPAFLDQIAAIRAAVPNIPMISNGNIITWKDVCSNLTLTKCDGIMSAEGILDNPALYYPAQFMTPDVRPEDTVVPIEFNVSKLQLAKEYLELVNKYPTKLKTVIFHIRR